MSDIAAMLEGESGRIHWVELQTHFARGVVYSVDSEINLIDVASSFIRDDKVEVSGWLSQQKLNKVSDEQARTWLETNPIFDAIVIAPWVLIQPVKH